MLKQPRTSIPAVVSAAEDSDIEPQGSDRNTRAGGHDSCLPLSPHLARPSSAELVELRACLDQMTAARPAARVASSVVSRFHMHSHRQPRSRVASVGAALRVQDHGLRLDCTPSAGPSRRRVSGQAPQASVCVFQTEREGTFPQCADNGSGAKLETGAAQPSSGKAANGVLKPAAEQGLLFGTQQ
jgi:hypothetical protein